MSMIRNSDPSQFGWLSIIRIGLVQTAIGAIVVLTTSTLNRVMVVELALPAVLPGALVGWHYAVQLSRPRWGYGSDQGGRRAPWIVGGMAILSAGGIAAALATALMATSPGWGTVLAFLAFLFIGIGVGASGTNLLAMLAVYTPAPRKAAAAAIVWIMMIFGFVLTAGVAGAFLDPFSLSRMIMVVSVVCLVAFTLAVLAIFRLEPARGPAAQSHARSTATGDIREAKTFLAAMASVWQDDQARRFTVFIFVSMLAYSAQDLILEPFAGLIHGYTPGESTSLAGVQNGGVLLGMIVTAIVATTIGKSRAGFMRRWTAAGCIASGLSLTALAVGAAVGTEWPLKLNVFALGLSNGAFAVAAIGSMMALASAGPPAMEGTRMGLWGASQAVAFGVGGFLGAAAVDLSKLMFDNTAAAFALVFALEGLAFLVAASLAMGVGRTRSDDMILPAIPAGEPLAAE